MLRKLLTINGLCCFGFPGLGWEFPGIFQFSITGVPRGMELEIGKETLSDAATLFEEVVSVNATQCLV